MYSFQSFISLSSTSNTTTYKFMLSYIIESSTSIKIVYKPSHTTTTSKIQSRMLKSTVQLFTIITPFVTNNIQMHEKVYT